MTDFQDEYEHYMPCGRCGKTILVTTAWTYKRNTTYYCSWNCYWRTVYPKGVQHVNEQETRNYHFKAVDMYSIDGQYIKSFKSVKDAAAYLSCNPSTVSDACHGRTRQAFGYKFRFSEKNGGKEQ